MLVFFPYQWTILKGNSSTNRLNLLKTVSNEVIFKYLRGKDFKTVWEGRLLSTNSDCLLPIFTLVATSISLKDGGYYCYCAYILRTSRYSDFLSPMLTHTGI